MGIERFIDKISVQNAVYWGSPAPDGYGSSTYADPVEIKVRWANKVQLISNQKGEYEINNVEVITNYELDVGGYLMLGTLNDISSNGTHDPHEYEGAYEIVEKEKIPMIRSTSEFVRLYRLSKNRE
jgi:hypothetical protein